MIPITKSQDTSSKHYDLEDRTLKFAKSIIILCKKLPRDAVNFNLINQIIRSASSIGANYREGNDALGNKDFAFRIRISRKEAKETIFWLELITEANPELKSEIDILKQECTELKNILSSIIQKVS